jgi:hypothetical protein
MLIVEIAQPLIMTETLAPPGLKTLASVLSIYIWRAMCIISGYETSPTDGKVMGSRSLAFVLSRGRQSRNPHNGSLFTGETSHSGPGHDSQTEEEGPRYRR